MLNKSNNVRQALQTDLASPGAVNFGVNQQKVIQRIKVTDNDAISTVNSPRTYNDTISYQLSIETIILSHRFRLLDHVTVSTSLSHVTFNSLSSGWQQWIFINKQPWKCIFPIEVLDLEIFGIVFTAASNTRRKAQLSLG